MTPEEVNHRTLIIPDVHEQYAKLLQLESKMEQANRVVLLGDFWDTFFPEGKQGLIATWLLGKLWDSKYTVLWGNHDCHYAFEHPQFLCSGYNKETKRMLQKEIPQDAWRQFKVFTAVGPYVVSHAGFHPQTLYLKDTVDKAVDSAFAGTFHPLWAAGRAVGGQAAFGGPTWLRWWELAEIGFPQIVGHTQVKAPTKDVLGNWNLDTSLKHVAWVDEVSGELTIEAI